MRRHGRRTPSLEVMTRTHGAISAWCGGRARACARYSPARGTRGKDLARARRASRPFPCDRGRLRAGAFMTAACTRPTASPISPPVVRCCPSAIRTRRCTRRSKPCSIISTTARSRPALVARFELAMLGEPRLPARPRSMRRDGRDRRTIYVSPKSGRAVSRGAGEPWQERLLRLPGIPGRGGRSGGGRYRGRPSRSPGFSWRATCWSGARRAPDARERSSRRCCASPLRSPRPADTKRPGDGARPCV